MRDGNSDSGDANAVSDEELSGPVVDRRTTTKLLGAAGLAGLAGCLGSGGDSETTTSDDGSGGDETETQADANQKQGGRLQAAWFTGSIDVLDPPYISVGQYFQVAGNVFNGLVTLKEDLTVRGDLAKDWTVENDGKKFTFQLREGVKFHNGDEFTADDVKYTIDRTISNEAPAAGKLSSLKSVDDGGVNVKGDYEVELNFEEAMAPALIYLTRGPGRAATIVNKNAIEEMSEEQYKVTPVGTGPFEVTEHEVGSGVTLDAFDDYFETDEDGNSLPYLDGIDVKPISEPATLVNALRGGDVDFANLVPLQNIDKVEQAGEVEKLAAPGVNWYGLAMNQDREPFGSKKARKGIAKSIDNEQFIQTAYFGNAIPAKGPINKATEWVWREDKPDDQSYNSEKGSQLIEEAGASGASFSILTTQDSLRAAKAMRQQLNSAGFDVSVEQVTSSTYWERYEKGNYDTTISGSVGDPDPDQSLYNFYRKPSADGVWNWVNYESDEVHELLAEQRQALDREERKQLLQQLEDKLIADVPHAYLIHQDDVAARRSSVKGFTHIPFLRNFHTTWLDE
ncbi:ABC transporter substrate-binding protein [Halorussus salinisoli]|uniref:ABC transporter substrate-binding protein n=1 Tax=Halorussus salinisoli TaxID=2558242 RepID=UPI0010C1D614|nr:ABC transporter substrate-binding protein [Halorussus salinisoli]